MFRPFGIVCIVTAALVVVAAGCVDQTTRKKPKPAAGGAAAENLPEINPESMLVVDDERLAVSSPRGWARGPRSKDYLVRYTRSNQKELPAVTVTSADPPEGFADVTATTHAAFVQAVASGLAAAFTVEGKSTLVKQPAAVTVGSHCAVAYAAPGQARVGSVEESVDRSFLTFVVNKRLVTVEARAPKGKLDDKVRLAAKAVAMAVATPPEDKVAPSFAPAEPAAGGSAADAPTPAAPAGAQ